MGEKVQYTPPDVVADTMDGEIQVVKDTTHVDFSHRHPSFPTLIRDNLASQQQAEQDLDDLAGEKRVPRIKWRGV